MNILADLFQECLSGVSHCVVADVDETAMLACQTVVDGVHFTTGTPPRSVIENEIVMHTEGIYELLLVEAKAAIC